MFNAHDVEERLVCKINQALKNKVKFANDSTLEQRVLVMYQSRGKIVITF